MKKISLASIMMLALVVAGNVQAATYTAQDVATHNSASNCWTIVNSKVYNLTSYIASSSHPGGTAAITGLCGIDSTAAFTAKHGSSAAANTALASLYLGDLYMAPVADTSAPSTPASLAATVTTSSVALSWTPSIDNVGVTGYNVLRGSSTIATTSLSQYTDTSVAASTSYSYSVSAFDAAGNTSSSSVALTVNTAQPATVGTSTATSTPKKHIRFKGNVDNFIKLINIRSNELVKIYVFSDTTLDASQIDMKSVKFAGGPAVQMVLRDLNRDKKIDAIISFRAKQLTIFNSATSSVTTANLVFATKDGKTYEQVIKVRVKYWKTEKQRQAEKRQAELKKQAEQKRQAELKKKQEQIKQQAEKKREELKKLAEKKQEALKKATEKRAELIDRQEAKKIGQLNRAKTKRLDQ